MSTILNIEGLSKRFGRKPALVDFHMTLESGGVAGLIGPNGAGKTTFFKTLVGIYKPDAGNIKICGERVGIITKQFVSYLPDRNHLFPWMRVGDTIAYYRDMYRDFDTDRAKELVSSLRLDERQQVRTLSRGGLERLLVLLTFARKARLYLLDEPFGGIDPLARHLILQTILSGMNEDSSIIIATHLVKDAETALDEVFFIYEGRLLLAEPADKIREERGISIEEAYLEMYEHA